MKSCFGWVKPGAIVPDINTQTRIYLYGNCDMVSLRMFYNVVQDLFYWKKNIPAKLAGDKSGGENLRRIDRATDAAGACVLDRTQRDQQIVE